MNQTMNFCGIETNADGTIFNESNPAVIDNVNSYMGQPVVDHQWANDPDNVEGAEKTPEYFPNSKGGVLDVDKATYNWENFNPQQATTTTVQRTVFQSAISDSELGKGSEKAVCQLYANAATEGIIKEEEVPYCPTCSSELVMLDTVADADKIRNAFYEQNENGTWVPKSTPSKTVFSAEQLKRLTLGDNEVVALCSKGIYTYWTKKS